MVLELTPNEETLVALQQEVDTLRAELQASEREKLSLAVELGNARKDKSRLQGILQELQGVFDQEPVCYEKKTCAMLGRFLRKRMEETS